MKLDVYLYTLKQKGYLAYEYNPFRNYQTDVDLYKVETQVGNVLVPEKCAVNIKNGEILYKKRINQDNEEEWIDKRGNIISEGNYKYCTEGEKYATAGSLIDLDTDKLNFDLNHPVDIQVQPSYDGSVNLILNDDKNIPRIINSRFSAREKNTYEIVDRIGENDTNIYNSDTFDKDTSLYFQYEYNPKIQYQGFIKGVLPVGQYCFYFTYCDSDENESDYIAESGLIPVFIGNDGDAYSIDGGIKNQLSNKGIKLKLTNLDKSYNYLKVYYVRYFADYQQNKVYECKKIYKKYAINSNTLVLQITGDEEAEDLDPNILNISRFNPKSILAQAQCKNMLFFGNIVKNTDNYKELQDCALRISAKLELEDFENVDYDYYGKGYYDSFNMYNKVGYFNNEYYRFGVVFIYQNGTLSNVYNILGGDLNQKEIEIKGDLWKIEGAVAKRQYIKIDDNGWIKSDLSENPSYTKYGTNLNSKGVCKINSDLNNNIIGIKFNVPNDVKEFLKNDLGIRGLFFVRQKRVPNLIAQCYLLPMDEVLQGPVIEYNGNHFFESFIEQDENRKVTNNYTNRLHQYENDELGSISKKAYAAICPDFLLNQPYFNQVFNGSEFKIQNINDSQLIKHTRFYISNASRYNNDKVLQNVRICSVTEDVKTVALEEQTYRLELGKADEAYRFRYIGKDSSEYNQGSDNPNEVYKAKNIARGIYSPYLAIYNNSNIALKTGLYNIYNSSTTNVTQEYQNRMNSFEPFYTISDRYNFNEFDSELICWRGDCYLNQFTYRLNRNFNDVTLPNNDEIIDQKTWFANYKSDNGDITSVLTSSGRKEDRFVKISRSDINAVQLGSWITFKLRSPYNYALRSNDNSYVSEAALMGSPRSYYPRSGLLWRGENKIPDSYLYNDAYRATLGYKCYFTLQDVNYVKDTFSNRIQYSAISIQDSFKNNYRHSLSTYFRDYSQEYGSIQKLLGFEGYLLVIFEHAIGIAVINERVLAGQGDGEPVFINTQNILPEELTIITDSYGTQCPESVIKSEAGYVYGIDTVAKKIWRVKGQEIEILSDFKVNKFLVDNITISERELYPVIGIKNIKTHYNNNKKDVIFTFYDNLHKDEENVWSLCYNELLGQFITFYSWVPSYSENINTQFFTFDRTSSKLLSLLSTCNYNIYDNSGVLVDVPLLNNNSATLHYVIPEKCEYTIVNEDGTVSNDDLLVFEDRYNYQEVKNIYFQLEKDHWGNYNYFTIDNNKLLFNESDENFEKLLKSQKGVVLLYITPKFSERSNIITETYTSTLFRTEVIAITKKEWISTYLKEDFYLHGQAGIFNVSENLYPTYWYGEYHPFEFEFIVNDKIGQQKIFTDLIIISNKAEPESFHFEIEGDNYEFSSDKRAMYFRQEATKELYQNLGSDIIFDRYYTDVTADKYTYEQSYRQLSEEYKNNYINFDRVYPIEQKNLVQQVKSNIFPLYYKKIDTYNNIYHNYEKMLGNGYDFKNLSGSEIKWNRNLNQFSVITHIKNSPIDKVGRLRGNSRYKEGKWNIQIPSITFMQKNEEKWENDIPPIVINQSYIPQDITDNIISKDKLPNIYIQNEYIKDSIDTNGWTFRKETKIRDKWIKIRVRYSGKNLAIIHSLVTLYNISYS